MKLINNYLDSLETYLPDDMQQEVREELEASIYGEIEDKQEQLGRELNAEEQEIILQKIGHPMKVASSFLPNQQLIGPDYYPAFKRSLEITLMIVLGINLFFSIPDLFSSSHLIANTIGLFFHLLSGAFWAMAIVVVVFYFLEKSGVSLDEIYAWSAKDINGIKPKLSINRVEVFFEMIMEIVFLAWWNNLLKFPSSIEESGIETSVQLSSEWSSVHWSVNIIMGLAVLLSFYKIMVVGWNKPALISNILINLASLTVIYQITQFDKLIQVSDAIASNEKWQKLLNHLDTGILSILICIAIYIVWESFSNVLKLKRNR